jgi:hypothetical protein
MRELLTPPRQISVRVLLKTHSGFSLLLRLVQHHFLLQEVVLFVLGVVVVFNSEFFLDRVAA